MGEGVYAPSPPPPKKKKKKKKKKAGASLLFGQNLMLCSVKEGHVLFNDALNTFYLLLYGVCSVKIELIKFIVGFCLWVFLISILVKKICSSL